MNIQSGAKQVVGIIPKIKMTSDNNGKKSSANGIRRANMLNPPRHSQPYLRQPDEVFFDYSPNFFTRFKSDNFLCIEFSTFEIKLMRLIKKDKKYHVAKSEVISFQKSITFNSEIVLESIKEYYNAYKSNRTKVVLVLSGPEVLVKTIKLPVMKKDQVKEAVYWKLKQEISSFTENDLWDFYPTGEIEEENNKWQNILTVIARENFIKKYLDILNQLDIYPQKVVVKPIAFAQALKTLTYKRVAAEKNVAIIEIEQESTLLCIYRNGVLEHVKMIPVGSKDIDRELSKPLIFNKRTINIKPEKMELFKRKYGIINDLLKHPEKSVFPYTQLFKIMLPVLKRYVYEIKRNLIFYQNSFSHTKVQLAFLTGKGSGLHNLNTFLTHELGLMVYPIDLPVHDKITGNIYKTKEYTACFGAACHRGKIFNLVPKAILDIKKFKVWRKILILSSLLLIPIFLFLSTNLVNEIATQKLVNAKYKNKYIELNKSNQKYHQLLLHKKKMDQFKDDFMSQFRNKSSVIQNLKIFSSITPSEILLNDFSYDEPGTADLYGYKDKTNDGTLIIAGEVNRKFITSDIILVEFITTLDDLKYYKTVEMVNKARDEKKGILSFKLKMVLP